MAEIKTTAHSITLPLDYQFPDDVKGLYATNILIQHGENEFGLFFFQVQRPVILGDLEDARKRILSEGKIVTKCVAKIFVSPAQIPGLIQALQSNYDQFKENIRLDIEEIQKTQEKK